VTTRTAACPGCGAEVVYRWSAAIQTTCDFCRSILVRHDVALEKVGVVGDLPVDPSPIQRGTMGRWGARPFEVVGRIMYEHGRGYWNEWHLRFADGESGWLSDASLEYAVSVLASPERPLPDGDDLRIGDVVEHEGVPFHVTSAATARYRGVEGELPFEYWDKGDALFVDLRTADGRFATIDFSERPPLLFVGEHVTFAELSLRELREFQGWARPA
jgi:hypothetical protein